MNRRDFFKRTAAAAVVAPAVAPVVEKTQATGGGIHWGAREPQAMQGGYVTRLISGPTQVSIGIVSSLGGSDGKA